MFAKFSKLARCLAPSKLVDKLREKKDKRKQQQRTEDHDRQQNQEQVYTELRRQTEQRVVQSTGLPMALLEVLDSLPLIPTSPLFPIEKEEFPPHNAVRPIVGGRYEYEIAEQVTSDLIYPQNGAGVHNGLAQGTFPTSPAGTILSTNGEPLGRQFPPNRPRYANLADVPRPELTLEGDPETGSIQLTPRLIAVQSASRGTMERRPGKRCESSSFEEEPEVSDQEYEADDEQSINPHGSSFLDNVEHRVVNGRRVPVLWDSDSEDSYADPVELEQQAQAEGEMFEQVAAAAGDYDWDEEDWISDDNSSPASRVPPPPSSTVWSGRRW
jgi:hypothetical protein